MSGKAILRHGLWWLWQPAFLGGLLTLFGLFHDTGGDAGWTGSVAADELSSMGKSLLLVIWTPSSPSDVAIAVIVSLVLIGSALMLYPYHGMHGESHIRAGDEAIVVGFGNLHQISHIGLFAGSLVALFGGLVGVASVGHLLYLGVVSLF